MRSLLQDFGRDEFARLAGTGLAEILQVVPELRANFQDTRPSPEDDLSRFRIYESVGELILQAASRRALVLILEDLHWADAPSLILLRQLAGRLPRSRLMVIGTYRDRELGQNHPLKTGLADFVRSGDTVEIQVIGLEDVDAASLLRAVTQFEPADDLLQRLQARTGGNPFFLKELGRNLQEEADGQHQRRFADTSAAVPEGVGAVLRHRILTLSESCRAMLEVAAVAARQVDADLLAAVTGTARVRLLDLCDEAAIGGVLALREGGHAFAHGLFRDTIYDGLSTARRGELHGLIGRALEQRPRGGDETFACRPRQRVGGLRQYAAATSWGTRRTYSRDRARDALPHDRSPLRHRPEA